MTQDNKPQESKEENKKPQDHSGVMMTGHIKILHKRGQVWYTALDGNPADGKGLQASTSGPAKFIANEPTNAPE